MPDNLSLLDFYARFLVGQYAGMGQALNLDALRTAFEIDGVDRQEWTEKSSRLIYLHALVVETQEK